MEFLHIFNFAEIVLWFGIGISFSIYALRKACRRKVHAAAAGITLLVFSITDIIELFTGSWWEPAWLLVLNMICVFCLIIIFLTYKPPFSTAVVALVVPSMLALCYFVIFPDPPLGKIFYFLSRGFLILFPLIWILWGEKKKFPFPRIKKDGIGAGIVSGLCIGITILVLYINVFRNFIPTDMVKEKAESLGFSGIWFFVFATFLIFLNSAMEEYYWRWFSFSQVRQIIKPAPALWITSLSFALHHVVVLVVFFGWLWGSLFGLCVGLGGAIWIHHYRKYDSIWPSFISHAIVDALIMLIGFDMIFVN